MVRKIFLKIIISSLFLISCNNSSTIQVADKVFDISFSDNQIKKSALTLSSIADSIGYVKLETNSGNLIGEVSDIEFVKGKFYIWDRIKSSIYIFENNGSFFGEISKKGQGPGEYINLSSYDVNPYDGTIHIFDGASKRMLVYSDELKFLRSFSVKDFVYDFSVFPDNNYVFYAPLFNMGDYRRGMWRVDSEGNFIKQLVDISPDFKYGGLYPKYFCRINDTLVGLMGGEDKNNFYHISQNNFETKYHINIDIQLPDELSSKSIVDFNKNKGKVYTKNTYIESSNYLMFLVTNFKETIPVFYYKSMDLLIQPIDMKNDIDNTPLGRSVGVSNDTWIFQHTKFPYDINGKDLQTSNEQNPVLQIIYLK